MKATPIAVSVFMPFVPAARVELRLSGTFRGEADQDGICDGRCVEPMRHGYMTGRRTIGSEARSSVNDAANKTTSFRRN